MSIALTTYDGERHLATQLDSLIAQDYPNLEIVVSDDGSTDGTPTVLQRYADLDGRVRILTDARHVGFNENFARCFAACKGDLISPCDQDDLWHPQKTRKLVAALGNKSLAYCNSRFTDSSGRLHLGTMSKNARMVHGRDPRQLLFHNTVSGHAMVFRKSLLDSAGKTPVGMYYDWWLAFVAASLGGITFLEEPLVDYRRHPSAVTVVDRNRELNVLRIESLRTNSDRLSHMATVAGPYQPYMKAIASAWRAWHESYLDWTLFRIVWRDASVIYYPIPGDIGLIRHPAYDYILGHRLKKLIWPLRYREPNSAAS